MRLQASRASGSKASGSRCWGPRNRAVLHEWFDKLAVGGRVVDPLAPKPWGASDGQVIDRHGLHWLIGYEPES